MALQFISVLIPEFYWFTHPCARSGIVQPCQMPGRTHWRVFWIQKKGKAPANFSLYLHIYNIFDIRILNFSFQLTHPDLRFTTRFSLLRDWFEFPSTRNRPTASSSEGQPSKRPARGRSPADGCPSDADSMGHGKSLMPFSRHSSIDSKEGMLSDDSEMKILDSATK